MRKIKILASAAIVLALSACGSKKDPQSQIEYFPAQLEENGLWSLLSPSGEVLVADEFKDKPTLVVNGRFMVRNADGLWEIYTAEKKPRKVGGEYKSAGLFFEDVAPVAEKDKPVQLIDRDGKVKAVLDKIDGKAVESVSNFIEGIASFHLGDGSCGLINTKGKVVVPARYTELNYAGDGKVFATKMPTGDLENEDMGVESTVAVIDYKGNELFTFPQEKFTPQSPYVGGRAIVSTQNEEGDTRYGIIDDKGGWVLKPSSKVREISDLRGDLFVFHNGSSYGVMNLKGEIVLRAKYDRLRFADDKTLVASRVSQYGTESTLIDLEGNEIEHTAYSETHDVVGGKYLIVCESRNSYILIDFKGENVDKKLSFADYDLTAWGDLSVRSDYVDVTGLVDALYDAKGPAGVSIDDGAETTLKHIDFLDDEWLNFDPERRDITSYMQAAGTMYEVNVVYDDTPFEYTGESYEDRGLKPVYVGAVVECTDKLSDKSKVIFDALAQKIAGAGGQKAVDEDHLIVYRKGAYSYAVARSTKPTSHPKVGVAVFVEGKKISKGWLWSETTLDRLKNKVR